MSVAMDGVDGVVRSRVFVFLLWYSPSRLAAFDWLSPPQKGSSRRSIEENQIKMILILQRKYDFYKKEKESPLM